MLPERPVAPGAAPRPREAHPLVGVRAIALLEVAKGVVALLAASGLVFLRQLRPVVNDLALHLHLNPARGRPLALLHAIESGAGPGVRLLAAGVLVYAAFRFGEAFGLWRGASWALWLGALSAAVYVPFELVRLVEHPRVLTLALLVANAVVAVYLAHRVPGRAGPR